MKPEEKARQDIDRQLEQCGWIVQNHKAMNITAGLGVAVREFPLRTGSADYLLYDDGKAIGIIEAKPVGHTLTGVELQSLKYTTGLPKDIPHYFVPLPFAYESTGVETQFTNGLDPDARSREVFTFHRPEELLRQVKLDRQLRYSLQHMPKLNTERLWSVQIETVQNLEKSLSENRPRSLIQMASGGGKTYTACSFSYRLIKFAKAKRILFLVDRNNLGKQTLNEFQQYFSPYSQYKFTEEFNVQRLQRNTIDPASKVCITTIQRLYSILKGEEEFKEENEEESMFESESPLIKEPMPVVYNPKVPIETFDFIVVDECHRSIYNVWRQVLDYFDAYLIGLTATPTAQTIGFFNGNLVQEYSHERALSDGVNVGYQVYRIETKITKDGATLVKEPGVFVPHRDRRTRERRLAELDDDLTYMANQLDRDVVSENQEAAWTKKVWVYDLRTNMHFTLKTNPLKQSDLDEFVECYKPGKRHERKDTWNEESPEGRWRAFDYEELVKRDKVNLDIFWLKDKSLEESENLPDPDVLAQEIADDLQTALDQFTAIAGELKG